MPVRLDADQLAKAAAKVGDISSYSIAKRTGLSQDTVGRLRRGGVEPTARSLYILARAYGITVDNLMAWEPDSIKESA